jgi:16S rRNA (uracil1498-N3)-methyltransferase
MSKSAVTLQLGNSREVGTESPLKIHLVQGISRGERMDFVVQKATELGVERITPVLTDYGVVKLDGERAVKRRDHWAGVAASACEQSGRTRPPAIDAPVLLKKWFGERPADADADLVLRPGAETPLPRFTPPATGVCVLVGPEGGFSDTEYEDAEIAGFEAVSLGPRILRTETAAAAAIAVLQARWGDLRA